MMIWARRLLQPLDYLRIEHPRKRKYDLWIPLALAMPFASWLTFAPGNPNIFGYGGLLSDVGGLLQILTGFYIASLAAVATFNKRTMDLPMPGDPPTLALMERGHLHRVPLSRRRFLCVMLGYLAFLTLILYVVGLLSLVSARSVKLIIPLHYHITVRVIFVFVYVFLASNLFVTTLLALYYMADRIHRPDSRDIEEGKENRIEKISAQAEC
jgi:hypothetical protein